MTKTGGFDIFGSSIYEVANTYAFLSLHTLLLNHELLRRIGNPFYRLYIDLYHAGTTFFISSYHRSICAA